jgi:hypothetical protein
VKVREEVSKTVSVRLSKNELTKMFNERTGLSASHNSIYVRLDGAGVEMIYKTLEKRDIKNEA